MVWCSLLKWENVLGDLELESYKNFVSYFLYYRFVS